MLLFKGALSSEFFKNRNAAKQKENTAAPKNNNKEMKEYLRNH